MALGIQLKGQLSEESSLKNLLTEEGVPDLLKQIDEANDGWRMQGRLLNDTVLIHADMHSGLDDIVIQISTECRLLLRVKTTPSGPGYHQVAVKFIDIFTELFAVEWVNLEEADNTGFLKHRDVAKLENVFVEWLQGMAKFILENPTEGCVSLDLPHSLRVEAEDYYATPLGPRDKAWVEDIAENAKECVLDYYCWWSPERDASYYQGVALLLGWNLVAWRKPRTRKEEQVMKDFVSACSKAVALEPDIELPRQAWVETCRHLGVEVPKEALKQDQIGALGYRRGLIHYPLGAGWSVCLPGSFSQEVAANAIWRGWDDTREVRVQIFPLKRSGAVEEILPRMKAKTNGQRFTAMNSEKGFYGVGDLNAQENDRFLFEAEYLMGDSVLALAANIPAGNENWIKGVWESVRRQ